MDKKEFAANFAAAAEAHPSQGDQADNFCSYLRGYAQTINDHTFEEAADFIDELYGELYIANEELAGYREVGDNDEWQVVDLSKLPKAELVALVRSLTATVNAHRRL